MCGIVAEFGGSSRTAELLRGVAHRGPDQQGVFLRPRAGLGAARLRVVGGAGGDQPLLSPDGAVAVVFNGEIFNYRELGLAGASDAAELPRLLGEEGPRFLSRIRGPFALAAFDTRDETLLLARDERGVRPLFLAERSGLLLAASEVAPLLPSCPRPDRTAWDHLLAFQFWPPGRTLWEDVQPLPPGTWRRYRRDAAGRLRFEEGPVACGGDEGRSPADLLREAFRLQGACERRTGIALSGGLDSSAVAGGLAMAGAAPGLAAVGYFPGGGEALDERPHARAVARELSLPLMEVPISPERFFEAWPKLIASLGGPMGGPGGPAQRLVSEALAAEGVAVVFSGQGGDEIFGGYERTRLLQQWDRGEPLVPAPGYEPLVSGLGADPVSHFLFRGAPLLPWLEPARRRGVLAAAGSLPRPVRPVADRVAAFESSVLLPGLLAIEDRVHGAYGMEGRVPLLDPLAARACERIPLAEKSPPSAPREFFRSLLPGMLPKAAAARRDKLGFPVPLAKWFAGPGRAWIHDTAYLDFLPEAGFREETKHAVRSGVFDARQTYFLLSAGLTLAALGRPAGETVS